MTIPKAVMAVPFTTKRQDTCQVHSDFGHGNMWGQARLKFDLKCELKKGHKGPHIAEYSLFIVPSFDPRMENAIKKSIRCKPESVKIEWKTKT